MDDFLETLSTLFGIAILIAIIIAFVAGLLQGGYLLKGHLDNSYGVVYCDGEEFYTGELYRISKELETHNLQSPMFSVKLRAENNFYDIQKKAFCKDLRIKGE